MECPNCKLENPDWQVICDCGYDFRTGEALPPAPPGWNKTIDDLFNEMRAGTRKTVGRAERKWAEDYERSLLPEGIRFPRNGDVYEAIEDVEIRYMTSWLAPYTGGGQATLLQGERVIVDCDSSNRKPLGVYAAPECYKEIEIRMVPEEERTHYKYSGFYLSLATLDLNTKFRLVAEGPALEGR